MRFIEQAAFPKALLQHPAEQWCISRWPGQQCPQDSQRSLCRRLTGRIGQKAAQPATGVADPRISRPAKAGHQECLLRLLRYEKQIDKVAASDPLRQHKFQVPTGNLNHKTSAPQNCQHLTPKLLPWCKAGRHSLLIESLKQSQAISIEHCLKKLGHVVAQYDTVSC